MDERLIPDGKTVGTAEEYRRRKTTSVLAIVFTDIAGSTHLREKLGEIQYEKIREAFEAQFADVICRDDAGAVVKGTGDGALAVFAEPSTAVERCIEVQDSLRRDPQIKLRIGIDMGQVSVKSSFGIVADVFGRHVNRAARIEALAEPGHILTSYHVYDCAMGWLRGENIGWHNHGAVNLKGFDDGISIHEVYDPRHRSPQSDEGFVRWPPVLFSLAAQRATRLIRLDQAGWNALFLDLKNRPVNVKPTSFTELEDPFFNYKEKIADTVAVLVHLLPESPSILWVNDFPQNNASEHELLRDAGCLLYLASSTGQTMELLAKRRYFLIITDMGRGENTTAGLDLLRWRKAQEIATPVILYASTSEVAMYGEDARAEGCALCTAGVVSLLDGVYQVLREYQGRIPFEFIEEETILLSTNDRADGSGWASRLRRFLGL